MSPSSLEIQILPPMTTAEQITEQIAAGLRFLGVSVTLIPVAVTLIAGIIISRFVDRHLLLNALNELHTSDILQINATVIAGVLIFLTIGHIFSTYQTLLTTTIIFPFAISSIRIISRGIEEKGVSMAIDGFIYLMASVVVLSFLFIGHGE